MLKQILEKGYGSLDLGITWKKLNPERFKGLEWMLKEKGIFFFNGEQWVRLEIRAEHYYKLEGIPPVLWINGIKMQEGKPLERAKEKAKFARGRVLDICTGLGYTAIAAAEKAKEVITIEKDPNVLLLASFNPYSQGLFSNPKIRLILGDAFEAVKKLKKSFDFILLDPPRFSLAPELYSLEFYLELSRLLKSGSYLYHYIGNPRAGRIRKGVKKRLREAGFKIVKEDKYGILCAP